MPDETIIIEDLEQEKNQQQQVLKKFYNCKILRNGKLEVCDLWVRNGKIVDPGKIFYDERSTADVKIDCKGAIISPGFIDLQINGGFGIDFTYNVKTPEEGVKRVAKELLKYGVTSFCPTLVTSTSETYHEILPRIKRTEGGKNGAAVLGVHLEGPFINRDKKGAHTEEFIQKFHEGFQTVMDVYGNLENVCCVTLAPELAHAYSIIQRLSASGIKVALGHSNANLSQGEKAVKSGATFITHLFNAMLPFHHRDPGLVGLLATCNNKNNVPSKQGQIFYGIISDGVHTHPAALRIAHRTHPKGLVLVSDAISALGLEEGSHQIGQKDIEIRNGQAYIAKTNTLCGSTTGMSSCVRFFKKATGCSVVEALEAATLHPAQVLEMERKKGVLNFGADADLVMLEDEEQLEVVSTWIAGECVYSSRGE